MPKPPPQKPSTPSPEENRPEPVRVTAAKCVRCGQPVQPRYRPFCSSRCAEVDLGQWASETYRLPTADTPSGPDEDDGG